MGLYTDKTEISHEDYLKLEGLLVLGRAANRECNQIARAIAGLLGEEDPATSDNAGHAFDAVINDYSARELLRKSEITVLPPEEGAGG